MSTKNNKKSTQKIQQIPTSTPDSKVNQDKSQEYRDFWNQVTYLDRIDLSGTKFKEFNGSISNILGEQSYKNFYLGPVICKSGIMDNSRFEQTKIKRYLFVVPMNNQIPEIFNKLDESGKKHLEKYKPYEYQPSCKSLSTEDGKVIPVIKFMLDSPNPTIIRNKEYKQVIGTDLKNTTLGIVFQIPFMWKFDRKDQVPLCGITLRAKDIVIYDKKDI